MFAGEVLLNHVVRQQCKAKDFDEYFHLQTCIDAATKNIMWRNKELIEQNAVIQSEIDSMLLETA